MCAGSEARKKMDRKHIFPVMTKLERREGTTKKRLKSGGKCRKTLNYQSLKPEVPLARDLLGFFAAERTSRTNV